MQIRFYYLNWKLSLSNLRPNLILCSAESSIFHWYFSILQLTPVTIATLIYGNLYLLLLVLNKFTMKHTQNYFGTKGRSRWFFRGVSSVSSIKVWNKSEYAQQWFIIIWILQMQFGPPCSPSHWPWWKLCVKLQSKNNREKLQKAAEVMPKNTQNKRTTSSQKEKHSFRSTTYWCSQLDSGETLVKYRTLLIEMVICAWKRNSGKVRVNKNTNSE